MSRTHCQLLVLICALFALGVVMIFSTTSADLLDHAHEEGIYHALLKQLGYGFIGFCLAWFVAQIRIEKWLQWSPYALLFFSFLLILVLIPGIGREANGAKRWLNIGGISFQPSEFLKFVIPLYLIEEFRKRKHQISSYKECLVFLAPISVPLALILLEPNNGTAVFLLGGVLALLFVIGVPKRYWGVPVACFLIACAGAALVFPYVSGRIDVFLHPDKDLLGRGHQPYQAKIAVGSGGLWGKGAGNSWQKLSYLPEAQNDYIAAIYAEEFGFAGILLLLMLYLGVIAAITSIAFQETTKEPFYIDICVLWMLVIQAALNLAVVSGLAPSTGLNLPFFSQGGSSLMANLAGLGLLFSARRGFLSERSELPGVRRSAPPF